jgi:hypothetical protein
VRGGVGVGGGGGGGMGLLSENQYAGAAQFSGHLGETHKRGPDFSVSGRPVMGPEESRKVSGHIVESFWNRTESS